MVRGLIVFVEYHVSRVTAQAMGSTTSKEEVIIAQASTSGANTATATQEQLAAIKTVLLFVAVCMAVVIIGLAVRMYRRCHHNWIEEKMRQREVQKAVQMA